MKMPVLQRNGAKGAKQLSRDQRQSASDSQRRRAADAKQGDGSHDRRKHDGRAKDECADGTGGEARNLSMLPEAGGPRSGGQ